MNTVIAAGTLATDFKQWQAIKKVDSRFDAQAKRYEERGTVGEQLGDWLLEKEAENKPSNLEVLADLSGQAFARSMRASIQGDKSVDVRRKNSIDDQMKEGIGNLNPEINLGMKILEKMGFDLSDFTVEEISYALNKLRLTGGYNVAQQGALP